MPRYRVVHAIGYRFTRPLAGASLELRLTPRTNRRQLIEHHQILVEPRPRSSSTAEDGHGNTVQRLTLDAGSSVLQLTAITTVRSASTALLPCDLANLQEALAGAGVDCTPVTVAQRGLCRERSERALAALDAAGLECRYVSGYLLSPEHRQTLPHAWLAVRLPRSGWLEYDPTILAPARSHLKLALGRIYEDVAPVSGQLTAAGPYRLVSTVDVEPL